MVKKATSSTSANEQNDVKAVNVIPPEMVLIPAGDLIMGISDEQIQRLVDREEWAEEWYNRDLFLVEQPQHRLHLPAYEIARAPVTNIEYYQFVWETGHRVPRAWIGFAYLEGTEQHPVTGVSRLDALAYCKWLSDILGSEYRLPSEAEWERAARGDDARIYPWGNEFDPWRCNTAASGRRSTSRVGEYSPGGDSPWGVVDLSGNVWEWTSSLLKPYPYQPDDGREDPDGGGEYVIRGGAWYYSHKLARCSCRESARPDYVSPSLGFRLARSINP